MSTRPRSRCHGVALLAAIAAALLGSAAGYAAAPANDATSTIYLQRDASGRLLLTDRPSPLVVTERRWQLEREDPVAAQQRAVEMRRAAAAVSERVQRTIDRDERARADADAQTRADRREREAELARAEAEAPIVVAPFNVFGVPPYRHLGGPGFFVPGTRPGYHGPHNRVRHHRDTDRRASRRTSLPAPTSRPWRQGPSSPTALPDDTARTGRP